MRLHRLSILILQILLMTGCVGRIKPGHATVETGEVSAAVSQSQDPQAVTTQTIETETVTHQVCDPAPVTQLGPVTPAASQILETTTRKKISTSIGAAQKNTAQEIGAKLASVRGFQWFGIALALFGVASLVYPPLKLIVASVTTSAACIASGAVIVFLPLIIVGHELLIIGLATAGVGVWFIAHRHGDLRGENRTLKREGR